jgi:malonate transporter
MTTILIALVPVFLLIVLGWGFRHFAFVPASFWPPAEKLTYYVFFPALLFINCARAPLSGGEVGTLALGMGLATSLVAGLALIWKPLLKIEGPAFSSLFQGTIRPNTYVGLAAAVALYGKSGLALTAVCVAVVVPLVNLFAVFAMIRFAHPQWPGWAALIRPVLTNPLIAACLLGLAVNWLGIPLPPGIDRLLDILGGASLPIGLLAVGAGVDFEALRRAGGPVLAASFTKLLVLPLTTLGVLLALGAGGEARGVALLYAALPCSASSYVLARQMGGDSPLMANIISVQTIAAALSMPLLLILLT